MTKVILSLIIIWPIIFLPNNIFFDVFLPKIENVIEDNYLKCYKYTKETDDVVKYNMGFYIYWRKNF